jgi:RNA recognition motif-containing protein
MPFGFTGADIHREFEPIGRVVSVDLEQDLENATFDAFAYVEIETDDVDRMLNELDGKRVGNRLLRVNEAVIRREESDEKLKAARLGGRAASKAPVCVY